MRRTYSYSLGGLGAFALAALLFINTENVVLAVIGGIVGFLVAFFVVRAIENALYKGAATVERKIRSGAASNEDDLLNTDVIFTTNRHLADVRRAVSDSVTAKNSKLPGKMKVKIDSEQGVEWEIGVLSFGEGCKIQLSYGVSNGQLEAIFGVVDFASNEAISPFVSDLMKLRNEVITAFKSVDPQVNIETRIRKKH